MRRVLNMNRCVTLQQQLVSSSLRGWWLMGCAVQTAALSFYSRVEG